VSFTTAMPVPRKAAPLALTAAVHTLAFDSSTAAGDSLVLVVEQVANTGAGTPTAPGWTLRGTTTHGTRSGFVLTKQRAADETSVTITRAANAAGRAVVLGVGGADLASIIVGTPKTRAGSPADSSTTTTALGITTDRPDTLVLGVFGEATTAAEGASFVPAVTGATVLAYAGQSGSSDIETVLLTTKQMATPGATGNAVATYPNAQASNAWAMMIGLPSVQTSTTPPPITRLPAKMSDGQGGIIDVGLVGWDGAKEVELSKVELVHSGTFVPDLDRTSRVWWMAHRGGSDDNQEQSKRGYLESAIRHADVLEFSVAITLDGKLIGAHDSTADRTSSSVNGQGWRFDQHTWAEVQQLVQDLPNRNDKRFASEPYMLLDDFVSQWAPSHTLMFDWKGLTAAQRQAGLARVQQIPDYQRRVLGKFYTTGIDRAAEWRAIGCKAWGYSYTADVQNGATERTAGSWDYLGLEHNAAPETWAEILRIAGDKRVIAHIVSTAAQAQAAVAKGARALQVSGPRSVSTAY
jgi:hypothetical protein